MTTKKMLKLKGMIKSLVFISLSAGILQSCNKLEDSSLPEATHNADLAALDSSSFESDEVMEGSLTRRPNQDITNPSWTPGNYDPIVALNYQIRSPQKIKGDTYRFVVTSKNFARKHIYIRYNSPQGNEVFEQMRPNLSYSSFEVQRRFQQEGVYHIRFYVESTGSVLPYPRIHQNSYTINVELPVNVPTAVNDYFNYMRIVGRDGSNGRDYEQWGFFTKECVSWVAHKVNRMWNTDKDFSNRMFAGTRLSTARYWKSRFVQNGYRVDKTPKPGAIIWWGANPNLIKEWDGSLRARGSGHVGFVHKVENGIVYYSDYNGDGNHQYNGNRQIRVQDIRLAEFIHVQRKLH
ncbi:MAG: CHAP domain-containing protein [bacterium]|nr:CHAP domain-containing protein [bacterium]